MFDRIKDYPQGYRVAANLVSSVDHLAMTLGMKPGLLWWWGWRFLRWRIWRRRSRLLVCVGKPAPIDQSALGSKQSKFVYSG
jgi:hypothetical protein